jgi:hypothetical protein
VKRAFIPGMVLIGRVPLLRALWVHALLLVPIAPPCSVASARYPHGKGEAAEFSTPASRHVVE